MAMNAADAAMAIGTKTSAPTALVVLLIAKMN
jgi:hypothetical protein